MIVKLNKEDAERVESLARATWPSTFKDILTPEQIEYMLNWMYNPETLRKQMEEGHEFYVYQDEVDLGFIGMEPNYKNETVLRIHKIYVLPEAQGKSVGKKLMHFAEQRANNLKQTHLNLNVNRFNNAVDFYKYLGFNIVKIEDIDIGDGFYMNDYVMEKSL